MMNKFFAIIKKIIPVKWHYVLEHVGFKKYFANTGWMFLSRIFTLGISFFVSVYMARNLGVENYGTLNFVMSFVGVAGTSIFAIDNLLIRRLNYDPGSTNKILGSALIIKIINSLLTIAIATMVSYFSTGDKTIVLLVLIFSTHTIFQSFSIIDIYFQAHADVKKISIIGMVTWLISTSIKIVIISSNMHIVYLLFSYVFDHAMNMMGYIYVYEKYVGRMFKWRIDKKVVIDLIISSWPFTISIFATSVYMRIDQVFLKFFLGSNNVGFYVVAVRFSEVWFFISNIIVASLLPAILNAHKTNYQLFLIRSKRLYSLLFYSAVLISMVVFLLAPILVATLYGNSYQESMGVLRIYIWSIVGVFVSTALQQFLLAENKLKTILVINVIGMTVSVVGNLIFIPLYGMSGAAFVNIFAYTLPFIIIMSTSGMKDQRVALIAGLLKPLS